MKHRPHNPRTAPTMPPFVDALIAITHTSLNTMLKKIATSTAIATVFAASIFTPKVHSMSAEESFKFIQVVGEYMEKLNNIFKPAPPTQQPSTTDWENSQPEADTTEIQPN
jgi:hypothetical protein